MTTSERLAEAGKVLRSLETERGEESSKATAAIFEKFRQRVADAESKVDELQALSDAEAVAANSDEGPPDGTRYEEWDMDTTGYGAWKRRVGELKPTGRYAVIEHRTPETRVSRAEWRLPGMGKPFLRVLKKNGEPSTLAERLNETSMSKWRRVK